VRVDLVNHDASAMAHHPSNVEATLPSRSAKARKGMAQRVEIERTNPRPLDGLLPGIAPNIGRRKYIDLLLIDSNR
jgi:hypothetical protein